MSPPTDNCGSRQTEHRFYEEIITIRNSLRYTQQFLQKVSVHDSDLKLQ